MRRPAPLPDDVLLSPTRVADAVRSGVGPERLRRTDLIAPVHGVRIRADRDISRIDAIAVVLRPDQFFSHTTAAAIWGGPLPLRVQRDGTVHVSTMGTDTYMRRPGVVPHRTKGAEHRIARVRGLPVGLPEDTWFECAGLLGSRELVALGDHFVGRSGLATIAHLEGAVRAGHRFARRARTALERVRVGSESAMETEIRLVIVDAGFPEPELNVDIHDDHGVFLGRVDMVWRDRRIIVEYDGDHHRDRETFRHDQRRANGFAANNWTVIHATGLDAHRPMVLLDRLQEAFTRSE